MSCRGCNSVWCSSKPVQYVRRIVEYAGNDDAMKAGELESLVAKGLVARAAFGVQKAEQFLKRFGVGRISEEGSFTPDLHQVLVFELFEVMRKRGAGDVQFHADLTDHQAVRMGGKQEPPGCAA